MITDVKQKPDEDGHPMLVISSDKFKEDFKVVKAVGGHVFYEIITQRGPTPKELVGRFTSLRTAEDAVRKYERRAKETQAAKTEYFKKEREKRKNDNVPTE